MPAGINTVSEILLDVFKDVCPILLDVFTNLFGMDTDFYFPQPVPALLPAPQLDPSLPPPYAPGIVSPYGTITGAPTNSPYGAYSQDFIYNTTPDRNSYFLYTGIIKERLESDFTLDPYNGAELAAYSKDLDPVPVHTKMVLRIKENKQLILKIKAVQGLYGLDNLLYRKYSLIPFEAIGKQ